MKAIAIWVTLALGIAGLYLGTGVASAQTASITISSNAPVPILIGGNSTDDLPAPITSGTSVCRAATLNYVGPGERWVFQNWSHGPTDQCITLTEPGSYSAVYSHEVLLQVRSTVAGVRDSRWVPAGVQFPLEVPAIVEGPAGVRDRFLEWNGGESPFDPKNVIAPLVPTLLEPIWTREYFVTVVGANGLTSEGSGWFQNGASAVIRAQDVSETVPSAERLKFASWEVSEGATLPVDDRRNPIANVTVTGPATFQATYDKQFFVVATAPSGTIRRGWFAEGQELLFEVSPIDEIIPGQQRLVFTGWQGQQGLNSPRISGIVSDTVNISAVYELQYNVLVEAPYGSTGGGWRRSGSLVKITVPESVQSRLIFEKTFTGFGDHVGDGTSLEIMVDGPIMITALYSDGVNTGVLALLLLLPLAAVLAFLANRWAFMLLRKRGRDQAVNSSASF